MWPLRTFWALAKSALYSHKQFEKTDDVADTSINEVKSAVINGENFWQSSKHFGRVDEESVKLQHKHYLHSTQHTKSATYLVHNVNKLWEEHMGKFRDRCEVIVNNLTSATQTGCILIRSSQLDCNVLLEVQIIPQFTDTGLELCFDITCFNMEGLRGTRELLKNLCLCGRFRAFHKPEVPHRDITTVSLLNSIWGHHIQSISCVSNRLMWQQKFDESYLCACPQKLQSQTEDESLFLCYLHSHQEQERFERI